MYRTYSCVVRESNWYDGFVCEGRVFEHVSSYYMRFAAATITTPT